MDNPIEYKIPTVTTTTVDEEDTKYSYYGWKSLRLHSPRFLSNHLFAYIMLCLCTFVQNFSVNGANNAVISTIENVFYLDSVQSGLFLALYDVATVFSAPIVGYLGGRYSSTVFFSLNMLIVGCGNWLIAISNFVGTNINLNKLIEQGSDDSALGNVLFTCQNNLFNNTCTQNLLAQQQHSSNAKALLYLGNFVNGIGSVALFSIGIAYIERIFSKDKAAYCQGIYFAVGTVGGALGIVVTGRFLQLYTKLTPRSKLPPWLTPSHPLWIGCWWLPYIIYGTLCIIIGLFVSGLPNYEKPGRKEKVHNIPTLSEKQHIQDSILPPSNHQTVSFPSAAGVDPFSVHNSHSYHNHDNILRDDAMLPTLETIVAEYRLQNPSLRKRQSQVKSSDELSSINKPTITDPDFINGTTVMENSNGFVNHAYSSDNLYNELPKVQPLATSTPSPSARHLNYSIESDLSTTVTLLAPSISTDVVSTADDLIQTSRKNQVAPSPKFEQKNTNSIPEPKSSVLLSNMNSKKKKPIGNRFRLKMIRLNENLVALCIVFRELMRNVRFLFIIIANLFEGMLLKGFVPFITKYFEYQHQLDTSTATLITGAIALLSVIIGCPIGAYFINRFKWTPMRCARTCAVILTMTSLLFLFLTLSCPELNFQRQSPCLKHNQQCCEQLYHPVCQISDPKLMYLSPCHFGCISQNQSSILENQTTYYWQCNCADSTVIVSESACKFRKIPCKVVFVLTLFGAAVVVFFTALVQVPMLRVLLYSVPLVQQTVALGLRQAIVRVLGQTSGPLLFGFVFDESCLVWQKDCYNRRVCKVYDNRRMGLSMALSGFLARFISGMACIVVFINWKWKHPHDGEENEKDGENVAETIKTEQDGENTRL
ncbi:unnamed protein product [Didymodactylos carnosus]|uniref:Kazal-like domain-containing protein n=1 Tax=Didymodactylos carnosus TaxID=1234261 RepID=A0A813TX42_9BILA|nr:unnamed protein product [Didymodactylos carnosus]CAF0817617.1 unnamed protein product [Didymodactylos carnosus]CAF3500353.1 unnamed protein product [Didymodactylos carnosus]CAF3603858.1 unnamed protein product [Didymodactylos carnosus]